jgi:hypothetical protein
MDNDKILIVRNYINREVLDKTPITNFQILEIYGVDGLYGKKLLEKLFLEDKIQEEYDYVVLVDEDCLVYDEKFINEIIDYMDENDYDICGMPDGGMVRMRFHRSDVPNLFFSIFKTEKIKMINKDEYLEYKTPCDLYEENDIVHCDNFEGYYKFLCYLEYSLNMTFLPLNAIQTEDDATVVFFNDRKICIHCWYSRVYKTKTEEQERIDKILEESIKEKTNKDYES